MEISFRFITGVEKALLLLLRHNGFVLATRKLLNLHSSLSVGKSYNVKNRQLAVSEDHHASALSDIFHDNWRNHLKLS